MSNVISTSAASSTAPGFVPPPAVNLLPTWYRSELRQRKRLRFHAVLLALLGASLLAWWNFGRGDLYRLRSELAVLERQASYLPDQQSEIEMTRAELKRLDDLQVAYRELGNTVPMSAVVQQIQNDMTPGMALSRLGIDVRSEAIKGTGYVGDVRNPPKYHDVAHLTVVGVAPRDTDIAKMISALSQNPLFADVSLNFMHKEVLGESQVRRFEIQMRMDLDRLAVEAPGAAEGGRRGQ